MRPVPIPALLVLAAVAACGAPRAPADGGPVTTAAADAGMAEAGTAGAVSDGGAALADPLAVFLEAAQTNLERPFPAGTRESNRRYHEAAQLLPPGERPGVMEAESLVPVVLAQSKDPRAAPALAAWALSPEARPRLAILLLAMGGRPSPLYLDVVRSVLANPELASEVQESIGGSFGAVLGGRAQVSIYEEAVSLATRLPGGRALVEGIADDRAASAPNPRTLAAFECDEGQRRVEDEARALSSLRLMALAALGDRTRWEKIGADPSEDALVRRWVGHFSRGRPDAVRERHREQEIRWSSVRDPDPMPCMGKLPGKLRDKTLVSPF